MQQFSLPRSMQEDFCFEGMQLVEVDDKDLATTPNWWQIVVYRHTDGSFGLSSTFWRNHPRSLPPLHGVITLEKLDAIYTHLVKGCGMPVRFANTLIEKTQRALYFLENPLEPLYIPTNKAHDMFDEDEELDYYDPIFVEDQDMMDNAGYQQMRRVTREEYLGSYI